MERDEPTRSNSPSCKHAQELHLNLHRQVADLVQENRPAVGELEPPLAHADRSREGAFLVPEQFAFNQRRRQRGTVDAYQRAGLPPAPLVQRPGKEFLAGAGRPKQQHARIRRRDLGQARQREPQRRALADDVVEVVIPLNFLFQIDVVRLEPGVQPFDFGHAGAQRVLVAAALQRGAENLRDQLEPFDQWLRPSPRQPRAVDNQRTDHLSGDRRRHAEDRADFRLPGLLPQRHCLPG